MRETVDGDGAETRIAEDHLVNGTGRRIALEQAAGVLIEALFNGL